MEEQPGLAMSSDTEETGFASAVAAFMATEEEPAGAPNAAPEGNEPKAPEPEPASEPAKDAAAKSEPEKLEEEFIEFTGKQKERFNSVYGALKRLERENAALKASQPVAPQLQPAPVLQPQQFLEPKPKLGDFDSVELWEDAATAWMSRKATHDAVTSIRQELSQRQTIEKQQAEHSRVQQFVDARINEGYQKFGQAAFDNVSHDLVNFAPVGSVMFTTMFELPRFADVAMELGKNLHEADRISRLSPSDQIYELKSLEKKLIAREELALKAQIKQPTKVEAPGEGEDLKTKPTTAKLRQAAKASGHLRDFAAIFQNDQSL